MKNLFRQWNSINIIYRILGGLLLGIILALVFPDASAISLLGTIFVNALKGIAPLLVFFLVISSESRRYYTDGYFSVSVQHPARRCHCGYCKLFIPGNTDFAEYCC